MAAPALTGWQQQLLRMVGARPTPQNLLFLNSWQRAEGGSAENNPFNTTQPVAGELGTYNSVGVRRYATPQQGLAATERTLENGRYGNILSALRQGTNARAAAQALAASPWGTGSLVLQMLGSGGGAAASPAPAAPSAPSTPAAPIAAAAPTRPAGVAAPIMQALALLGFKGALPAARPVPMSRAANVAATLPTSAPLGAAVAPRRAVPQQAPAPMQAQPAATAQQNALALALVPQQFDTRPGIQVSQSVLPQVEQLASRFGVQVNSGYRSPAHNASVGGAPNSDHLRGDAVDFTGPTSALQQLYAWAQGRFPYVEPWAQAKDHVHISFRR